MDHAEIYCLTMMRVRAKAMAFFIGVFGFSILLLNDPEVMDASSAAILVGFYALICLYYLVNS
ncbi:hypothetical protein ACO1M1_14405, partial [Staphylococcus aureus]